MSSIAGQVPARPLTEAERAALDFVLSVNDPRVMPLREQAGAARVVWECTCGCATINFEVDRPAGRPAIGLCSAAIQTYRRLPYEINEFCELLLFLEDGWLSSLELVWYQTVIATFPRPDEFEPPQLRC
jgi:hypothetical protein